MCVGQNQQLKSAYHKNIELKFNIGGHSEDYDGYVRRRGTFQKYYDGIYIKSLCNITRDYVTKWWTQQKMVVTDMCDGGARIS